MTLRRSLLPAIVIVAAAISAASAQFAPPGKPPCFDDFVAMRDEAQKRMKTAHEAGQRKAPAPEMCKLIGHYAEAEAKLLKFIQDNGAWCGMPPQLAEQVKAGRAKTIAARERICAMVSRRSGSMTLIFSALGSSTLPLIQ